MIILAFSQLFIKEKSIGLDLVKKLWMKVDCLIVLFSRVLRDSTPRFVGPLVRPSVGP